MLSYNQFQASVGFLLSVFLQSPKSEGGTEVLSVPFPVWSEDATFDCLLVNNVHVKDTSQIPHCKDIHFLFISNERFVTRGFKTENTVFPVTVLSP